MKYIAGIFILMIVAVGLAFSLGGDGKQPHKGHGEAHVEAEYERGPHRGRMLRDGSFAVEVTIFEDGGPPEYHVYAYKNDKPLSPQEVQLGVTLKRLDGEVNQFTFAPVEDYLKGDKIVTEPHSFDVEVQASHDGKSHEWKFASYEGRTTIAADAAKASGIEVEEAGPAIIKDIVSLSGQIGLNANATAQVKARFPGIVREVRKGLGDRVEKGEVLAVVESNDSLKTYQVTSPISGTILSRNTNVGDVAGDAALFSISDLSTVWAELHVFPADMGRVQAGQAVEVKSPDGKQSGKGTIASLLPVAENATQTIVARATLENPEGLWRAGMNVQGVVTVAERDVPLAVKTSGLQRFRDFTVVFAQVGETYEVRMLELGQDDGTHVEVLEGIKPGTLYVSGNSFLIRADIEKSGASHDH
jgi:cobalt-zinc-cadmium efflux system membrane fusion protein